MKIIFLHLIVFFSAFYGCSQKETNNIYKSVVPLSTEFLTGEWRIDSVYGSKGKVYEFIYFTAERKFWRFADHYQSESDLTDSALIYDNKGIEAAGEKIYDIYSLNSDNIIIVTRSNVAYHATRFGRLDNGRLAQNIRQDKQEKLLKGTWAIDSLEKSPTSFSSPCLNLTTGAKFQFISSRKLEVFQINAKVKCNGYHFSVIDSTLSFSPGGDLLEMKIEILNENNMVLASAFCQENWYPHKTNSAKTFSIYFSRDKKAS